MLKEHESKCEQRSIGTVVFVLSSGRPPEKPWLVGAECQNSRPAEANEHEGSGQGTAAILHRVVF
jgi:hypothetical protein